MEKILTVDGYGCVTRVHDDTKWKSFVKSMTKNNVFCPGIKRVLFNLKTTETKPVLDMEGKPVTDEKGRVRRENVACTPSLATVVYFDDGTKVSVVNSDKDLVTTEEKEVTYFDCDKSGKETVVKTGTKVVVASEAAKEAGVVYAIVKRIFGKVGRTDKQGKFHENEVDGDGFGRKLRELVSFDTSYDTQYEDAFANEMKKLSVKEHKAREEAAKENRAKRRPSLEDNLNTLVQQNAALLEKLSK